MSIYVQAVTPSGNPLFPQCGSRDIAGDASNLSESGGADFSIAHSFTLDIAQPHDQATHSRNSAHAQHCLSFVIPAYEPAQAAILNVINQNETIQKLVMHNAQRKGSSQSHINATLTAKNGSLIDYSYTAQGTIVLGFVFESISHDNKQTHTTGAYSAAVR